ncbi:hypothetical protein A5724_19420 [Mycobacterium sp. ACS1612]|uniref:hypothetical protein n=1 Tax=Mycobacterium sp. ACS1612 TaxID=1834117 RepID=UPI0007FEB493|nr:hypothetical protein [Mycobacterium sp. ACS1612]OBF33247.1 hypothetical protein A5724_19420 [Mycobacterium sp. ACS1612]
MPIYVVGERNQRVSIQNEALAVSVTGSVAGAELDVRAGAHQPVVRPTAHRAVLPQIAGEVTVGVRPVGAARFGAGTVVHLEIAHDNPADVDPVQVLFDPVDVSGESDVVLAALRPNGSHIDVGVIAVADVPLSPLGSAARSSARQLIGRTPARPDDSVVVALDVSASMRPWFADGSAAAATDIVVGVGAAAGIRNVSAVFVGADVTPVVVGGRNDAGLADAVRNATPRWSAGARWSRLLPGPRTIACVDIPTSDVRQRFPIIVLSDDRRFDAAGPRLPSPRQGHDASAELLAHPQVLDRITAALVGVLK